MPCSPPPTTRTISYDFDLVCSAYSGCGSPKRPPWTSPTSAKSTRIGCYGSSARATRSCLCPCPRPSAPRGRPRHRRPQRRADPAEPVRPPHGAARRDAPAASPPGRRRRADRPHAPLHAQTYLRHHDAGCRRSRSSTREIGLDRSVRCHAGVCIDIESDTGTRSRWSTPGRSLARSDCSVTICERVIVRHAIRGHQQMRPHDVSHQWSTCDSDGITLAHKAGLGTAAPCRHHAGRPHFAKARPAQCRQPQPCVRRGSGTRQRQPPSDCRWCR